MISGCILLIWSENKCSKYDCLCHGLDEEKDICPEWGKVKAYEKYLQDKLRARR